MSSHLEALVESLRGRASRDSAPAILCGERLGNAAASAMHRLPMPFQPYVLAYASDSIDKFDAIADHLEWGLKVITVPIEHLAADFVHLAVRYRCFTKAEFALGYIVMHASEAVDETEIWLCLPRSSADKRGWQAATRVARHHGKTLFNPFQSLVLPSDFGDRSMTRAAIETIGTVTE